jgi:hypothetical protein
MVIGAGSASFRMLEDLVRRLSVMVTPRWGEIRSQHPLGTELVGAA